MSHTVRKVCLAQTDLHEINCTWNLRTGGAHQSLNLQKEHFIYHHECHAQQTRGTDNRTTPDTHVASALYYSTSKEKNLG
jgi:hypothetical protein